MNERTNITTSAMLDAFKESAMEFSCPAQVLVIDRANGPADVLTDLLGRLFEKQVSTTLAIGYDDALYALNRCEFDLVIIGLEDGHADQFNALQSLQQDYACIPVVVVGRDLDLAALERCRQYEAQEVIEMPQRAAELKSAVFSIMHRYLQCA